MQQPIRFEENLYFVNEHINTIESGLALKIDSHIFFDKIVEDIFFVDTSLNKLYESVSGNYRLVQTSNILRSIQTTKIRFCDLLQSIISGNTSFEEAFNPFVQKLQELKLEHQQDAARIQDEYLAEENTPTPREGISNEEYSFLFPEEETT